VATGRQKEKLLAQAPHRHHAVSCVIGTQERGEVQGSLSSLFSLGERYKVHQVTYASEKRIQCDICPCGDLLSCRYLGLRKI
jgi:hypothetical protein